MEQECSLEANGDWSLNRALNDRDCRLLHDAALRILEETGVRLYEQEAVEIVRKAGASVEDGNLVRLSHAIVEDAIETAPKTITLFDRNGNAAMPVEGYRTFYGPGPDLLNIIDHRTGKRRPSRIQDVKEAVTLCDALENIDFMMSMFLPSDVDMSIADRYQMEIMLNLSTKPIIMVTYETSGWIDGIEMAEIVAGGVEELRERPSVLGYINVTTALRHNKEALQKLLHSAEKGLPVIYNASSMGGMSAPVTAAGGIALSYAGGLVGVVISQLKREGTPIVLRGDAGSAMDMRTMVAPYARPEYRGVNEALAHYYRWPMFTTGGVTDSKVVDEQAAAEAALSLLAETLTGGQIIHDLGFMASGMCGSLAMIAICNEIVDWVKAMLKKVEVNEETLALDLINQVGPEGHFIDTDHTLMHFRERWYPSLFERDNLDGWKDKGGKTLQQRACAKVEEILGKHVPEELISDIQEDIKQIVKRAEADHRV